ncbi:MAG TPA: two-component regulator propeller domain-containing protein, partial [Chitinophagaceae bacterium]|nr:two-component regulator propeller domain-containing protein [Chitinophagaceae bacterium]
MGGRNKGLHIYDRRNGRFYNYSYDPSREGTVSDNRINCIYTDRQGKIWLGTNRGISLNSPNKQQFVQTFLSDQTGARIRIYDFYEDAGGEIWIGTSEGIFICGTDGSVRHKKILYKGQPLHVSYFFEDEGAFYVGTNYSLFQYNRTNHALTLLPNTEKDSVMNRIIDSRVVSVVKDTIDGHPVLLTAPYGHFLAYYDLVSKKWISRLDSSNILRKFNLQDNLIRGFYKKKNGEIWMATVRQGLAQWVNHSVPSAKYYSHDPSKPGSISNNHVYDMTEDEKGNLWVSTYGGGLNYFDPAKGQFIQVEASNNLVEGIKVDHHQNVWMISNGDLHKYDPKRKSYSSYDLPDLEKTGGVTGKIFRDRKGRLFVAGTNYFIAFHPDSISGSRTVPQVYLTDFQIFNKSFSHLLQQEMIRLNYKDNYFAFEFSAPHYAPGSQVRYAYQLEGFDREWVEAGERNYVSYSNLEGGEYVFKVRATNTPGIWSRDYASIRITIIPPYWKRAWFYIACAVVLALATYAIYRYRINELLKRQAIRNKIAQDLHDNVGSTLSSISVYSQVARIYQQQQKEQELHTTLEKISATSSEMISELNDTVWAINPRNDHMDVILQRMQSFARPLLASQGVRFELEHDESFASLNLEMEKRKNFYLIFKEAVNNAVKYSDCKTVKVSVRQKGHQIRMTIDDDGKGFDLGKTSEGYKS